jgi:hypothetical protein
MTDKTAETCEICESELRLEYKDNCSIMVCKNCGHMVLNGIGLPDKINFRTCGTATPSPNDFVDTTKRGN